jgi:hypothetical protein
VWLWPLQQYRAVLVGAVHAPGCVDQVLSDEEVKDLQVEGRVAAAAVRAGR